MRNFAIFRLFLALAAVLILPAGVSAAQGGFRCEELALDVTLSPADTTPYSVFGVLCSRGSLEGKTVQVTIHGSTYSHLYWDWAFQPEVYSYVRRATAAGYAVLNIDRIGVGQSDHPPAGEISIGTDAYVVHQIVQQLRNGELVVPSFGRVRAERVALVGHSLGSVIAIQEAATYGDVDGVLLTGVSHTLTPALGDILGSLYPANLDPRFADRNLPDGYLTSLPGSRALFYHLPTVDPVVLAIDEQTKETVTPLELDTAIPALFESVGVHVPALVIVGDYDQAFCTAPSCSASGSLAAEASFFPADACVETAIVPDSGHDLNLQLNAQEAYDAMLSWLDRRVGSDPSVPPADPCQP